MFDFLFTYTDGNTYQVQNVTKIIIKTASGSQELSGDGILSARIPLNTMCLYSASGNVTVSGANLMVIDIMKKDN